MKFTLAILALTLGLTSFAQETTTNVSEESGILSTLKRNNIGLSFANEIKSSSSKNQINGFYNKLETFVSYKLSPVDSFKLSAGYRVIDTNNTSSDWDLEAPSLRYKRSNILTEDVNMVTFNSEARVYVYPNSLKISKFQSGNTSWRNTFSRKFAPDFKLSTELRWDEFLRTNAKPGLSRRVFIMTADPVYNLTETLSITPEVSFNSQVAGPNTVNKDFVKFKPMLDYVVNKAFATEIYWESTPMVSRDNKFLAKDFSKNGLFGLVLTYTVL